jgi:hypothetical protein
MSVLTERLPISSKNLARGAALFLTGAMLVGSLVDCAGEGPSLPSGEGSDRQIERVTSEEEMSPAQLSLGDETLVGAVGAAAITESAGSGLAAEPSDLMIRLDG